MYQNDIKLSLTNNENLVKGVISTSLLDTIETSKHKHLTLYCKNCGFSYRVYTRCNDRTCPDCRYKDYQRLLFLYRPFLASKSRLRLLTLTLKSRVGVLPQARLIRIRKSFKILLRQPYFSSRLIGGFYSIEAKQKEYGWNIHIHILYQGGFIAQNTLSKAWFAITKDSYIVDIREARSSMGGFRYILKYLTKSPTDGSFNQNYQYNKAFRGTRLLSSFGSWYIISKQKPKSVECPVCHSSEWLNEYDFLTLKIKAEHSPPVVSDTGFKDIHDLYL